MDESVDPLEPTRGGAPEADDVARIRERLSTAEMHWEESEVLSLPRDLRWRPDGSSGNSVLHIHLVDRLRPYAIARLQAAHEAGHEIFLAAPLAALYDERLLIDLAPLDAKVILIEDDSFKDPQWVLRALADGVVVTPGTRTRIARLTWDRMSEGSSQVKGKRLESLLAFLLSQVDDFRVIDTNVLTGTEELDVLVGQMSTYGRSWTQLGAPLIIVESKNWSSKVGQPEVSQLRVKMQGKRGTVRLGMLFGANGFTSDAKDQELRFASDALIIAFFGPGEIEEWIDSDDGDETLERLVIKAMIR